METKNKLFADVSAKDWNDWRWQVRNRIETLDDLKKYIKLTPEEEEGVARCLESLRMAITPYYLSLIDLDNPFDPVRLQAVPTAKELHRSDADLLDPLHEIKWGFVRAVGTQLYLSNTEWTEDVTNHNVWKPIEVFIG